MFDVYIEFTEKLCYFVFQLGQWFEDVFKHLYKVPRFLIPCYFDTILMGSYLVLRGRAIEQMSE